MLLRCESLEPPMSQMGHRSPAHDRGHEGAQALCRHAESHIRSCRRFAAFLERSPDAATVEDLRRFQLHLAETGVSICTEPQMTGVRSCCA